MLRPAQGHISFNEVYLSMLHIKLSMLHIKARGLIDCQYLHPIKSFSPAAPSFDAPPDFISEPLFNPSRSAYFCKKCAEILQCMANSIWFMNVLKNMAEIFLPTPLSIDSSASESKGLWFRIVSWCCDPSSSNSNSSHTLWSVPSSPGP